MPALLDFSEYFRLQSHRNVSEFAESFEIVFKEQIFANPSYMPIVAFSVMLLKLLRTIENNLGHPKQKAIIAALNYEHALKFWQYDGERFIFEWINFDELGSRAFISTVFTKVSDFFNAFSGAFERTIDFEYGIRIYKSEDEFAGIGHGIEVYETKVPQTWQQINSRELAGAVRNLKNGKPCYLFVDESNLPAYRELVHLLVQNSLPVRCLMIRSSSVQSN